MGGRELARRVTAVRPETAVLLISGYAGDATSADGSLEAGTAFLEKPFSASELAEKVRVLLDATTTRRSRPAA